MAGSAELEFTEHLDPVVNDPAMTGLARRAAEQMVGSSQLFSPDPLMGSEDMGVIQAEVPGVFAMLGCGNPQSGARFPHHHPRFAIDEQVLPLGVELILRFVEEFLSDR
jgi:amidohydrolase